LVILSNLAYYWLKLTSFCVIFCTIGLHKIMFSNLTYYWLIHCCRTPSATQVVNGPSSSNNNSSAASSDLEQVKQEILSEMRKEMNKLKQEILEGSAGPHTINNVLL